MSLNYKVEGVSISAIRDRAMFNTFANNKSYVVKDIGSEFEATYTSTSFVVTVGSGEAVICGGSTLCTGESVTLTAQTTGYLVVEIDLSQTGSNICQLKFVSSLVQGNINDGNDMIYDFPLARITTSASGVDEFTDLREIKNSASDIGDGQLTIQLNGQNVQTFKANQSSDVAANIVVPTIYSGTQAPSSDLGIDGDIYIMYVA